MPKDEKVSVTLDELTYEILQKEALRSDVSVGTKARHLIVQALKQQLISRNLIDSTLAEVVTTLNGNGNRGQE
jgi:hypothetical protein